MNRKIVTIIKESDTIFLTFTENEIRLKMPSYYLTEENHDYWINFIERIKPYIYRDFKQTLRGKRSIPTDKENLTITFKTWNKYNVKKIIVKNNKIKVEEYKKRNETNFQYIKRRIKYAIFS
jgi:hypothetical protein